MRVTTLKAGLKVFCISQGGDFFFILSAASIISITQVSDISLLLTISGLFQWDFFPLWSALIPVTSCWSFGLITALLLKSAQLVFFPWLLDAMEAPVPISAQLHSSTLVIIGFYVIFRLWGVVVLWDTAYLILLISGSFTALGASILGFFQTDGKKLLACSTAGQLGYVLVGLGLNLLTESLFLLFFCCTNKAFTFVWLGSLMDRRAGISDFRRLGLGNLASVERAGLFVSVANSTFFPGAFAFHVKALFSRGLLQGSSNLEPICVELLALTWFLSALYLFKLFAAIFQAPTKSPLSLAFVLQQIKDPRRLATFLAQIFIMGVLVAFSVFSIFGLNAAVDFCLDIFWF